MYLQFLVKLRSGRNVRIDHQQMELFLLAFLMNCGDQHAAGIDSHHLSGRQIRDCNAGLANQLFRFVIGMDAGKYRAIRPRN